MSISSEGVCLGGEGAMTCFTWPGALLYLGWVVPVLAMVLGVLVLDARRTPAPSQAAARANRHATLSSMVGVAMLVVILGWMAADVLFGFARLDGRVLAGLPALAGGCLLAAQALGQLTWPRPSGSHREAELARRRVADLTPAWHRRLVLVWAGAALMLLTVFGLVADGPRSMTREAGRYTEVIGPYPGWYYGVPMALAIVAVVIATELVLRLITSRPAVAGVGVGWDLRLRHRSASQLTRGIQLILAVTVAGILVAAGWIHLRLGSDHVQLLDGGWASEGSPGQRSLGTALLVAALAVLLVGLAAAFLPLRRGQLEKVGVLGVPVPT